MRPEPITTRSEPGPTRPEPVEGQPHRHVSIPLRGRWRLLRIAALGGASMLLATGAHLGGGGRAPSLGLLFVTAFLVGLTAVTVTTRRLRFGTLLAVLGVEQLLLHELFGAAAMTPTGCTPALGDHAAAMARCAIGPHAPVGFAGTDWGMLLAHVAATLATAWVLARGEQWLWRLCERAVRAATCAPTPRVRRGLPPRPLPGPTLRLDRRHPPAAPRGPPLAWVRLRLASV